MGNRKKSSHPINRGEAGMNKDDGFVRATPLKTGFHPPEQCVRGRTDCRSLAQIIATPDDGEMTYMCVGELAPGASPEPLDQWCFCHKSRHDRSYIGGVDIRFFVDRRDMSHMAAVLSMGLATVIPPDGEAPSPTGDPTYG
jgi:hypothetical protein